VTTIAGQLRFSASASSVGPHTLASLPADGRENGRTSRWTPGPCVDARRCVRAGEAGGLEAQHACNGPASDPHRGGVRLAAKPWKQLRRRRARAASGRSRVRPAPQAERECWRRGPEQCVGGRLSARHEMPRRPGLRPARCAPSGVVAGRGPASGCACSRRTVRVARCDVLEELVAMSLSRMRRHLAVLVQPPFLAAVMHFSAPAAGLRLRLGVTSDSAAMSEATRLPSCLLVAAPPRRRPRLVWRASQSFVRSDSRARPGARAPRRAISGRSW